MSIRVSCILGLVACTLLCTDTLGQKTTQQPLKHGRQHAVPDPFSEDADPSRDSIPAPENLGLSLYVQVFRDKTGAVTAGYSVVNDSDSDVLISPVMMFSWEYRPKEGAVYAGPISFDPKTLSPLRQYILIRPRGAEFRKRNIAADNQSLGGRSKMDGSAPFGDWRGGAVSFEAFGHVLVWDPAQRRYCKKKFCIDGICDIDADGIPVKKSRRNGGNSGKDK